MPELAEVERAKNDCKLATEGKIIQEILTKEDKNVFQGCTHTEFADALRGKRVANVGRLGKYFYLVMQSAPHVVMHLGMAGFVSTKGQEPLFYRKKAKNKTNEEGTEWPLRYWKFALKMQDGTEWCFCDSRRFGRISLIHAGDNSILDVEPLSLLGRDPYLDMPSLDEFSALVLKRKAPIKAVLLDQNGPLCGLGNWLVDEILFQAAIHPAQKGSTLSVSQLLELHKQITNVVNTAVAVNADHAQFPKNWLFKYRWGKGRRNEPATFTLPDGTLATVIHQTVGGRTSAIVESVQKLLGEVASDTEDGVKEDSEGEEEGEVKKKAAPKRSRKVKVVEAVDDGEQPIAAPKRRGRKAAKKEETELEEMTDLQEEEVEDEKVLKITARKRKASPTAATSKRKQKIEVKLEPASEPLSARASRVSARQARS